jgi:hypothetical protein
VLNENGANGQPPNSANFEKDSTHANLSECNMALVPSMHTKMAIATKLVSVDLVAGELNTELTEEEPYIETDDNHNDADNASRLQSRAESHVPKYHTQLLMS